MILTPLQKLPNNVGDLGKIIVATGIEWLPKVQKIANSGHTVHTSRRLQQLLQRARLLQIIGKISIFAATDCNSCWWPV